MADESMSSRTRTIIREGNPIILEMRANGTDIYPGLVVTGYGETWPDIDLCAGGEYPLGVVLEHSGNDGLTTVRETPDIDTAYSDNATVRVALLGSGAKVYCKLAAQTTTTAIYPGMKLVVDSSSDGYVSLPSTTDTMLPADWKGFVGRAAEYDAGGSDAKIILVVI